jgi:hypothetical protein
MSLRRGLRALIRLPAVMLCSLAAHAFVYRTLWPTDGAHGYFGWYEPAVAAASLAAVGVLLGLLALAVVARRLGRPLRSRETAPRPFGAAARSLAASSFAFLLLQETLERSVQTGHPAVATFRLSEWVTMAAALALVSSLLTLAQTIGRAAVRRVLGATGNLRGKSEPLRWTVVESRLCLPRPLALGAALRGPPLRFAG